MVLPRLNDPSRMNVGFLLFISKVCSPFFNKTTLTAKLLAIAKE